MSTEVRVHEIPRGLNLIIRRDLPKRHSGTIELPDTAAEKVYTGTILSKGRKVPDDLQEGLRVRFTRFAGTEVERSDEGDLLLVSEEDVISILQ